MVIYNRDKKELIIPTGFGYDCSEAIASARTEGYNEGKEDGVSVTLDNMTYLYDAPRNFNLTNGRFVKTYNPLPNVGYRTAEIDYSQMFLYGFESCNQAIDDGILIRFYTGRPIDSGATFHEYWHTGWFNLPGAGQESLNSVKCYYESAVYLRPYIRGLNAVIATKDDDTEVDTIWSVYIVAKLLEYEGTGNPFTGLSINGEMAEITQTDLYDYGEGLYGFYFKFNPIAIPAWQNDETIWNDGYESGYTDGISAERPTSSTAFTENGVYTTSGGWNQVIVNVHESAATVNLQEKNIVVDNFYHYVGDEIVVTPDAGYDGLSAVTISAVTTDEIADIINNNLVVTEGIIDDSFAEAGSAITITENGIYTPSGGTLAKANEIYQFPNSAGTRSVGLSWNVPNHFNRIEVNVSVPHWNNYCSGSFSTSAIKVWSSADEQQICFFEGIMPVNTFDKLTVDGVSLLAYCTEGYTMQPGQHKFVLDMDGMRDDEGWTNSFVPTPTFPNLTGNITYNFYRQIK